MGLRREKYRRFSQPTSQPLNNSKKRIFQKIYLPKESEKNLQPISQCRVLESLLVGCGEHHSSFK